MENIVNKYYDVPRDKATVRGFFFLKDSNGDIIATNENMIVQSGRVLILGAIYGDTTNGFKINNLKGSLGSDGTLTTPNDNNLKSKLEVDSMITNSWEDNSSELYIKYTGSLTPSTPLTIQEFGLFSGTTLFSRVVFPTVYLNANTSYTIEYYIYF